MRVVILGKPGMEPQRTSASAPEVAPTPPSDAGGPTPGEALSIPTEASTPPKTDTGGNEDAASAAPEPARESGGWRYWLRPLVLSVLVMLLLGLTLWDMGRVPDRPARPTVLMATPAAGATVSASDPGLTDALARLRQALARRDARLLATLADPDGVLLAAYSGGLPDSGFTMSDTTRFAQDVLGGSQQLTILGWRNDGRGRVIVLTDGWAGKPLRSSANSTLELTSLSAIGLVPKNGTWYWRYLLPDSAGNLAQQARSMGWQELALPASR